MRPIRTIVLVLSFVCLALPAWADFQTSMDANNRGDYATALREWRLLAELLPAPGPPTSFVSLQDAEREYIRQALLACRWVLGGPSGAAAKLGMKRTSLQYKI